LAALEKDYEEVATEDDLACRGEERRCNLRYAPGSW